MKIALITVHKVTNYGAILQAYATREALSNYGEVQILDYQNPHLLNHLHLFRFKWSIRGIKMLLHDVLNFPYRIRLRRNFLAFIDAELNLTAAFTGESLDKWGGGDFDLFVCGSDQIWNPAIINAKSQIDPYYFLGFVSQGVPKMAFASSMGNYEFSQAQLQEIKSLLTDFSSIAVREKEGAELLRSVFPERKINHVLDPTLLLGPRQWLSILNPPAVSLPDEYILVYSVPRTPLIRKAVLYYSEKFRLPVVAIDKMLIGMKGVDHHIRTAGPREFIGLFSKARFIITDSFHGTCFSVNFGKSFVCIPATPRANRQEGLLSALGLSERIVYEEAHFGSISSDLDYSKATPRLNELRAASLESLKEGVRVLP